MERTIGYLMKQITDRIKISADASLKSQNLTLSQARVLDYISSRGCGVTQKSIEEYLNVSHPTVVGIVSRMEKNGYLRCCTDKADRRNKIVRITEQASWISREMQGDVAAQEAKLLQGLTDAEIESLRRMLHVMYKNIASPEQ